MHYSVAVFSKTAEQADWLMKKYTQVYNHDFEHFDPEFCEWEIADEAMLKEAEESVAREKSDEYTFEVYAREMEQYRKSWDLEEDFDEFIRNEYIAIKSDENNVALYMREIFEKIWCEQVHAYAEMHNPNGVYDWFTLGGRFANALRLKPGCSGECSSREDDDIPVIEGFCDRARLADISLEADKEEAKNAARYWDVKVDGAAPREGEDFDRYTFSRPERFTSRDHFVDFYSRVSAYDYIDPNGKLHRGARLCFCEHGPDGTYRLNDELLGWLKENPDLLVSIYDTHI